MDVSPTKNLLPGSVYLFACETPWYQRSRGNNWLIWLVRSGHLYGSIELTLSIFKSASTSNRLLLRFSLPPSLSLSLFLFLFVFISLYRCLLIGHCIFFSFFFFIQERDTQSIEYWYWMQLVNYAPPVILPRWNLCGFEDFHRRAAVAAHRETKVFPRAGNFPRWNLIPCTLMERVELIDLWRGILSGCVDRGSVLQRKWASSKSKWLTSSFGILFFTLCR